MEILLRCCENHNGDVCDFTWKGPPEPKRCPKCGNMFDLVPRVRVYLIVQHKDGPIRGSAGRRYYVPSTPAKDAIVPHVEGFTSEWRGVTNPACMRTKEYQELKAKDQEQEFYRSGGLIVPDNFIEQEEPAPTPAP